MFAAVGLNTRRRTALKTIRVLTHRSFNTWPAVRKAVRKWLNGHDAAASAIVKLQMCSSLCIDSAHHALVKMCITATPKTKPGPHLGAAVGGRQQGGAAGQQQAAEDVGVHRDGALCAQLQRHIACKENDVASVKM